MLPVRGGQGVQAKEKQRQDSLEGGGQTGADPVGLLDTHSFLPQTFKCPHVPGIGWDGKAVGSTGVLGQSGKRWVWKSSSDGDCQRPSLQLGTLYLTQVPQQLPLFHREMRFHGLASREQCGLRVMRWNWKSRSRQELGYIGAVISPSVNLVSKASFCLPPPLMSRSEKLKRILTLEKVVSWISALSGRPAEALAGLVNTPPLPNKRQPGPAPGTD